MYTATTLWVTKPVATYKYPVWTSFSSTPSCLPLSHLSVLKALLPWVGQISHGKGGEWAEAPSRLWSGNPSALHSPSTTVLSPIRWENKNKNKSRFLSKASRSLSFNFSSSRVLYGFLSTHPTLPKYILLFQDSKPFHSLLLPRRGLSFSSFPENSHLYFKILSNVTPQRELVQPFCPYSAFGTFCTWFLLPITQYGVICFRVCLLHVTRHTEDMHDSFFRSFSQVSDTSWCP